MTFRFMYGSGFQSVFSVEVVAVGLFCLLTLQGCTTAPQKQNKGGIAGGRLVDGLQSKGPAGRAAASNHLKGQTSPYLLQHASDPVDWYPWGDEAFERAKRENKPVFLSSGFAACHWCHVMHHESFQDPDTAKFLNANFISIKVDREERPYVDEVYSRAAQVVGGRAGWPLTVFLTPDKKPFFAGTYFPNTEKYGLPSFSKVLQGALDSYHRHRGDVDKIANELCKDIYDLDGGRRARVRQNTGLAAATAKILENVDIQFGGMQGSRKFALPGALSFALQVVASSAAANRAVTAPAKDCLAYVESTLEHIDDGAMHDQLNGGFFRYTADREWHVPHFEKMLSGNALIAQIYLQAAVLTGNDHWKKVGLQTLDFCLQNLRADNGGFYGSTDADSAEGEGAFYKYTAAQITQALGPVQSRLFSSTFSLNQNGKAAGEPGVLYLSDGRRRLALAQDLTVEQWQDKMDDLKAKLRQSVAIKKRVSPRVDKKIIAAWNGLMISALVEGYRDSSDETYLTAAKKTALFVLKNLCQGKNVYRVWADNKAEISGCLDDYAYMIRALLDLASVDSDPLWLQSAEGLNDSVTSHFFSHHVGFYYSADNKDQALMRFGCARDDGAISPFAAELDNLLRLYTLTGHEHFKDLVNRTIGLYDSVLALEPASFGSLLAVMETRAHGQDRLLIKEGIDKSNARALARQLWSFYAPHVVSILAKDQDISSIEKSWSGSQSAAVNQFSSDTTSGSLSAAFYCNGRSNSCDAPVNDPELLRAKLAEKASLGAL